MIPLVIIGYIVLCLIVAKLLEDRRGGFYLMLLLSLLLTPLLIGITGILFSKKVN